jgi:hypothetical protein
VHRRITDANVRAAVLAGVATLARAELPGQADAA